MAIDEVDRKIVALLLNDARKKRTDIARVCGVSSTTVHNRIRKLKQKGVIVKHTWNVDWPVFGYNIPVTIGIDLVPEKEKAVRSLIAKRGIVIGSEHFLGRYGLSFFFYVKNNEELKETELKLRQIKGVDRVELHIWNRDKKYFSYSCVNKNQKRKFLDSVDIQIFRKLLEDPEKSFLEIAKEMVIAPITVQNRYVRMEKMGILKPSIVVDYSQLGYPLKARFQITTSSVSDNELVFDSLGQVPNIFLFAETIGVFDVIAIGLFKDLADIQKMNRKLRAITSVERVIISITDDADFPYNRKYDPLQIFALEKFENLKKRFTS
jgi:Lrp/AsnC family transcriptional regulator for asnA, asnC and gidA